MLKNKAILVPAEIDDWVIIYRSNCVRDEDEIDDFINGLKQAAVGFNIKLKDPYFKNVDGFQTIKYT